MKKTFYSSEKQTGLSWNHLGIVALCSLAIFGILFLKNGKVVFTKSFYIKPTLLTYEGAKQKALARLEKEGWGNSNIASEDSLNQLSDSESLGRVLGLTTQSGTLIEPLGNLFSAEQLQSIQLKTTNDNSKIRIEKYFKELVINESVGSELSALLSFSQADASGYEESAKKSTEMVSFLKSMEVPTELSEFHKYKLIYYTSLSFLARSMLSGSVDDPSVQKYATIFFSVIEKINSEKDKITNKYEIQL